jgi:hypothetical protein
LAVFVAIPATETVSFLKRRESRLRMTGVNAALMAAMPSTALPVTGQQTIDSAVARLRAGQPVRLSVSGNRQLGRVVRTASAPGIADAVSAVPVDIATIDSLWVRTHATRTGAIVGGGTLGLTALLVGPGLVEDYYSDGAQVDLIGHVTLALAGAGVGAILGGVIGRAIPKWRLIYNSAPQPSATQPRSLVVRSRDP